MFNLGASPLVSYIHRLGVVHCPRQHDLVVLD